GKLPPPPTLGRPFQLECVRLQIGDWKVTFDGPCSDLLLAGLYKHTQFTELAAWFHSQLLAKLPLCRGKRLLALLIFSFRDRPRPEVLPSPYGPAGMHQEQEKFLPRSFVHQDSCVSLFHRLTSSRADFDRLR